MFKHISRAAGPLYMPIRSNIIERERFRKSTGCFSRNTVWNMTKPACGIDG
jgi:hypothetical protein